MNTSDWDASDRVLKGGIFECYRDDVTATKEPAADDEESGHTAEIEDDIEEELIPDSPYSLAQLAEAADAQDSKDSPVARLTCNEDLDDGSGVPVGYHDRIKTYKGSDRERKHLADDKKNDRVYDPYYERKK